MLDESLPTYRLKSSSENPLHTVLYFTHNGSEPSPEYLIKRPDAASSAKQYAVALVDPQYAPVVYAEVLLQPDWTQPTLSAAEIRAQNGPAPQIPNIPDSFAISLYNPDQSIAVRHHASSWNRSEAWEFEIPERTFVLPSHSHSRIDQDAEAEQPQLAELVPKLVFRWKRDGRLSKDMTCYMTGKSVGGEKSKEPDITVAMFRGKNDSMLTIYEPNMARVELEDRKGLELALLMSAEVIKDLYINPRQDPFNAMVGGGSGVGGRKRAASRPSQPPPGVPAMSGALHNASSPTSQNPPGQAAAGAAGKSSEEARRKAEVDAETRRLQAMVAEEERQQRAREEREREEQKRIKKMVDKERRQREAEVDAETERLRREYGMEGQDFGGGGGGSGGGHTSPQLPPRPGGQLNPPAMPPRPVSVGPSPSGGPNVYFAPPPTQQGGSSQQQGDKKKTGLGGLLQNAAPYTGPAAASVSGFFGKIADERERKKVQKKRSNHF